MSEHPSVKTIEEKASKLDFNSEYVVPLDVFMSIRSLKNKAPGHDKISAKILKSVSLVISRPLANIFNCCVDTSIFPSACKKGEVTPSLKRGADTEETNYRPLSVLPAFGKLFEDLMLIQMQTLNNTVLHTLVSAYRPGYSCQNVLLYMLNAITDALDNGKFAAAVTTDLSSTACLQI